MDVSAERHDAATLAQDEPPFSDAAFRPVLGTDEGSLLATRIGLVRSLHEAAGYSWGGRLSVEVGSFEGDGFAAPRLDLSARRGSFDRRGVAQLTLAGGILLGTPPAQRYYLIGGRHTLPGHPYRRYAGDRFALADIEVARDLLRPLVRARAFAGAGWTNGMKADDAAEPGVASGWDVVEADPVRGSIGGGLGLLWDLLRIDIARGLGPGGETQLLISIDPKVWPIL